MLYDLSVKTDHKKSHLDYLTNIREEFSGMTKQELVEKTVLAYDRLDKITKRLRSEEELFEKITEVFLSPEEKFINLEPH